MTNPTRMQLAMVAAQQFMDAAGQVPTVKEAFARFDEETAELKEAVEQQGFLTGEREAVAHFLKELGDSIYTSATSQVVTLRALADADENPTALIEAFDLTVKYSPALENLAILCDFIEEVSGGPELLDFVIIAIHQSNMSKLVGGATFDENNKIQKGEFYQPADLAPAVDKLMSDINGFEQTEKELTDLLTAIFEDQIKVAVQEARKEAEAAA